MVKVSIVVPVYNIEDYLKKCIDSLLCQTLKDIEIILVDDGSTDNSASICDQYAASNGKVRVIHKQNGGLSDARNAGITQAKGTFIGFIDGDDYAEPIMFEKLYQACFNNNTRLAACDYAYKGEKKEQLVTYSTGEKGILSAEDFFLKVLQNPSAIGMGVWNKLYHRDLFQHTHFTKGLLHEDTDILYRLVFQVDYISYISCPYYIHCERSGSITKYRYGKRDHDRYKANKRMFRYIEDYHPHLYLAAADNHARSMVKIVDNMVSSKVYDKEIYKKICHESKKLLPKLKKENTISKRLMFKLWIISLGYYPYRFLCFIYRLLKK